MHPTSSLVLNLTGKQGRPISDIPLETIRSDGYPIKHQIRILQLDFFQYFLGSDIEFDLEGFGLVLQIDHVDLAFCFSPVPKVHVVG
jgi:hypothetical protein